MLTPVTADRVTLRMPMAEDAATLVELLSNYDVSKMLSKVPHPYELEHAHTFVERAAERAAQWPNGDEISFAVDHFGELIGGIAFRKLQQEPVIGYWLGQPHWGKGYMSEAVTAALAWLFGSTGHDVVVAEVIRDNVASQKLLMKLGFEVAGESSCASQARGECVPAMKLKITRDGFTRKGRAESSAD